MALTVVGAMYAVFLALGWFAARKVKDGSADGSHRRGPRDAALARHPHDDRDLGGRRVSARHRRRRRTSRASRSGLQGGLCFGISLILGGLFFARRMRAFGFTTLVDPFEARFGRAWAAVLSVPAMAAEVFWSAELLVALGSTFGVHPRRRSRPRRFSLSAVVVTAYTMVGGMWSVAYTDALQLGLVVVGLARGAAVRARRRRRDRRGVARTTRPRGRTAAACCRRSRPTAASGRGSRWSAGGTSA